MIGEHELLYRAGDVQASSHWATATTAGPTARDAAEEEREAEGTEDKWQDESEQEQQED